MKRYTAQQEAAAFEAIVGTAAIRENPLTYPDTVVLPQYVHERALGALALTQDDRRERSIHFFHREGRWGSGPLVAGRNYDVRGGATSGAHQYAGMLTRPHIELHTHPDVSDESIDDLVEHTIRHGVIPPEQAGYITEQYAMFNRETAKLPSALDVQGWIANSQRTVAAAMISSGGNFLTVATDQQHCRRIINRGDFTGDRLASAITAGRTIEALHQDLLANKASASEVYAATFDAVIAGLQRGNVSYHNPDPTDPHLRRVG